MKKNHLLKILSSLIVKFSDVQAENCYFQVKFIKCYLREIIRLTKKIDIRDWGQSTGSPASPMAEASESLNSMLGVNIPL